MYCNTLALLVLRLGENIGTDGYQGITRENFGEHGKLTFDR